MSTFDDKVKNDIGPQILKVVAFLHESDVFTKTLSLRTYLLINMLW